MNEAFENIAVKVGWMESAVYPDGTPVALVAAVQNGGSPQNGIEPSAFFEKTIASEGQNWIDTAGNGIRSAYNGNTDAKTVMEGLGLLVAADVQKTIANINEPISEQTLFRRQNRKNPPPTNSKARLRDTLYLFNTLTSVTEDK